MDKVNKKNVKFGIILSYVLLFVNLISHFFFTPFLLGKVGETSYGIYSFALSLTSWFNIIVYALNDSYSKFASDDAKNNNGKKVDSIYFAFLIIFGIAILLIAFLIFILMQSGFIPLTKYNYDEQNLFYILYFISIFSIFVTTIFSIFKLKIEYKEKFIFIKLVTLIINILQVAISVIFLCLGANIVIISLVNLSCTCINLICNLIYSRKKLNISISNPRIKQNLPLIKNIVIFSSFLLLSAIVGEVNSMADNILLGFFSGPHYVTIYTLSMTFVSYLSTLSVSINSVFIAEFNNLRANNKIAEVKALFLKISKVQTLIITLIVGGFFLVGREFIRFWLGYYDEAIYWTAFILLVINSFHFSSYSSVTIERAYSKHKIPCLIEFFSFLGNVIITIILLIIFPIEKSISACLIGTAICHIMSRWILMPIYRVKQINLPYYDFFKDFFVKMFVSFLISFFISRIFEIIGQSHFLGNNATLLLKGFSFVLLYFCIFYKDCIKYIKILFKRS